MEMLLASQMSISGQQVPIPPTPALASLSEGSHPSTLACTSVSEIPKISEHSKFLSYQTVDELDVTRALRVAVTSSILGTGFVVVILAQATVGVHRCEVESTVQTAREVRDVNVKGELIVEEIEGLVCLVVLHKVHTRANILTGDKCQGQRVTSGRDTIGTLVVGAINRAVRSARLIVRAKRLIPLFGIVSWELGHLIQTTCLVTSVAVGGVVDRVSPTPVGVEHDGTRDLSARSAGFASLPCQGGVSFLLQSTCLLGPRNGQEGREEKSSLIHIVWKDMVPSFGVFVLSGRVDDWIQGAGRAPAFIP